MARTKRAGRSGLSPGVSAAAPGKPAWGEEITSSDLVLAGTAIALYLLGESVLFSLHALPATRAETDGIGYMLRASGPAFQLADFHGPGYSWAIRAVASLGVNVFAAAKIVSIAAGAAFLVFSWVIVASVSGPRAASLAAVLMAASPAVLLSAASILSDMPAAVLFLGGFALLCGPRRPVAGHFAASGAAAGLAYLTRSIYATALVAPVVIVMLRLDDESRSVKARRLSACFGAFAITTAPWLVFVYREKGNPFWSLNHLNLAFQMYRNGQGWNAFPAEGAFSGAWDVVRSNPGRFVSLWFHEIAGAPSRILHLIPPLAAAAAVGCLIWFFRMNKAKLALLLALTPYLLAVCLVWYEDRYYLIFVPLAAVFVSDLIVALGALIERLKISAPWRKAGVRAAQAAALTGAVALCVPQTLRHAASFLGDEAPEYRAAGDWLRWHGGRGGAVLAAKPHIAFYCGARDIRFRDVGLQEAAAAAGVREILERARPDFFVYDERYSGEEFPELRLFLDEGRPPLPGLLTPVFVAQSPLKVVVYRVSLPLAAGASREQ